MNLSGSIDRSSLEMDPRRYDYWDDAQEQVVVTLIIPILLQRFILHQSVGIDLTVNAIGFRIEDEHPT